MLLSSLQLDAFLAVAQHAHFTRAARVLGLSQPALSQRVRNLEAELAQDLFTRRASGVRLTAAGERLFQFARTLGALERELRADLGGPAVAAPLRVAAFSSVARALVIPALGEVTRAHAALEVACVVREMRDIVPLLTSGEVDYAVVDRVVAGAHLEHVVLGAEENVLVEGTRRGARRNVYLDHDAEDATTAAYFAHHGRAPEAMRRNYLDDIESIVQGVVDGLGRAVVPAHLTGRPGMRRVPGFRVMRTPVVVHFTRAERATSLHEEVLSALRAQAKRTLGAPSK